MTVHDIALLVLVVALSGVAFGLCGLALLIKRALYRRWLEFQINREIQSQQRALRTKPQRVTGSGLSERDRERKASTGLVRAVGVSSTSDS